MQTSRSRVTSEEPCSTPANPPTMTKSMFASHRRSMRRLRCTTQSASRGLQLQSQLERRLMLLGALVIAIAQADFQQTDIDSCLARFFDGGHGMHPEKESRSGSPGRKSLYGRSVIWRARKDSNLRPSGS